jgi:hypothetical protein
MRAGTGTAAVSQQIVVGLGDRCQAAYQIKHRGLNTLYFPFDYMYAPFESLYQAIDEDFAEFLEPRYLTPGIFEHKEKEKRWLYVRDTRTGLEFHHDFPSHKPYTESLDRVRAKYQERIKNFRDVIASGRQIAFIRHRITREETVRFHELIQRKFPDLDYVFVALDDRDEVRTDWKLDRTRNFYVPFADDWKGDFDTWTVALIEVGLIYPEESKLSSVILPTSTVYSPRVPRVMSSDVSYYFDVVVHNKSSVPWPLDEPSDIRISYRWLTREGDPLPESDRPGFVPWTVQPGRDLGARAVVVPPAIPGKYRLRWELSVEESTPRAASRAGERSISGTEIPIRVR